MNLSKVFKLTITSATVLGAAVSLPWAFCSSAIETYAIFQCSDRAYFEPVPNADPLDASAGITGAFWQFGFGNLNLNNGTGTTGTAFASKAFNGNDSGLFTVDVLDTALFPGIGFPDDSVCLGSNNWANSGVDGCCDNPRPAAPFVYTNPYAGLGAYTYNNDDHILNPYFGTFQAAGGFPGYYSLASMMDYPTAVMLKTPGDAHVALAAVSNMTRNNTGGNQNGPCNSGSPGTNPAPCDIRQGFFSLQDVTNGNANVIPGVTANNAIPWQPAPRPREVSGLDCSVVDCGGTTVPVRFAITPLIWYTDQRSVPTNNPTLDTRDTATVGDTTRARGVGPADLLRKWAGLARYTLEVAPIVPGVNTDPNGDIIYSSLVFADDPNSADNMVPPLDGNGNATGPITIPATGTMDIPIPSCWRARVGIGKPAEAFSLLEANARVGKLGDLGLGIATQNRVGITCFGNRDPLVSENIINGAVRTVKGRHTITWDTTAELTVQGFDIFAVTQHGSKLVGSLSCTECSSGAGASYETTVRPADIKGGKVTGFQVKMKGGSGAVAELPVR